MAIPKKEQTNRFLEITDPKKAVGLWSCHVARETAMMPVGETDKALGRFLNGDIVRWEHRQRMAEVLGGKGVGKKGGPSPAKAIGECLAEADAEKNKLSVAEWRRKYAWLLAWSRYACRLPYPKVVAAEKDVQMFFNAPCAGIGCNEGNLHGGRVFFLRKKTQVKVEGAIERSEIAEGLREQWKFNYFVCVVLKPGGTKWWWSLERVNVTWTTDTYDRLIIDPRGKLEWSPMDAGVLTERVVEKDVCLFQLEDDALFAAITDNELNPGEKYAHLCCDFDFFYSGGLGKTAAPATNNQQLTTSNFYLRWSAFFNPKRSKYTLADRSKPRIVEVMGERGKRWLSRRIEVKPESDCDAVARWVVENNGCAVLPADASDELRLALSHALFFVTFHDRRPNELGGILRGYQLPGRLVEHAAGKVRGDNSKIIRDRMQKQSEEATARRRKMVVDCLFARACAAVLSRNKNVLDEQSVVARMTEIGARQIVEKAAWQRGFMEGNPLNLFKPGPTAGNLKLPDLSLALMFENRLGLKGETASAADLLVQTAAIRSLKEAQGAIRESISGCYSCRSVWTPKPGKGKELVAYSSDSVRVLCDEGRYYLMTVPKFALYQYDRDLAFEPDEPGKKKKSSVSVFAHSFKTAGGVRSRADSMVIKEVFDYNKVTKLAREGRICLYSIDFGKDKWIADLVYSTDNQRPCKIVPTIPLLAPLGIEKKDALQEGRKSGTDMETKLPSEAEAACAFIGFTFNPSVSRDPRKVEGRSWKSYCDAFPAETRREIVRWPSAEGSGIRNQGLGEALQKVIETDGVLLTDKEHLDEALRAATYVVRGDPYQGYNLKDRVFSDTDARVEWREKQELSDDKENVKRREWSKKRFRELKGKPLCEVLSPALAKEAEVEFTRQIEADSLSVKVGEAFKDAVVREFRRIAYTGTMGWKKKLNRPAHEVAVGIWLAGL